MEGGETRGRGIGGEEARKKGEGGEYRDRDRQIDKIQTNRNERTQAFFSRNEIERLQFRFRFPPFHIHVYCVHPFPSMHASIPYLVGWGRG